MFGFVYDRYHYNIKENKFGYRVKQINMTRKIAECDVGYMVVQMKSHQTRTRKYVVETWEQLSSPQDFENGRGNICSSDFN